MNPIDIGSTLANLILAIFVMHYFSVIFKDWTWWLRNRYDTQYRLACETTKQMEIAAMTAAITPHVHMDCLKQHVGKPVLVVDNEPLPSEAAAEK